MAHQQSPKIRQLAVKLTQEAYRQLEKEATYHRLSVAEYARFLVNEATLNTELTEEDYAIIRRRIEISTQRIHNKQS